MKEIKTVLIVGLGALGMIYADALQKTPGCEVFVLVDAERKKRYERDGHMLNGEKVSFNYVLPSETQVTADLILHATKSNGMRDSIDMMENFIGEETIIISLMNGVTCEELLIERYGAEKVLYAIYLGDGATNIHGHIRETGKSNIFFGPVGNPRDEEQTKLLDDLFTKANIRHGIPEDMYYAYWRKFVLIVAYNQTCAVLDTNYSVFVKVPKSMDLAIGLIRECIPIAKASGVKDAEMLEADLRQVSTKVDPACLPSITQDRRMQRRMEVDIFADEIIRLGEKFGIETPLNNVFSKLLHVINITNGCEQN